MSMSPLIPRIRAIETQIDTLKKILTHGTYQAAGISVSLTVGVVTDESESLNMEFGIPADCEGMLKTMLEGLEMSLAFNLRSAKSDYESLGSFLRARNT